MENLQELEDSMEVLELESIQEDEACGFTEEDELLSYPENVEEEVEDTLENIVDEVQRLSDLQEEEEAGQQYSECDIPDAMYLTDNNSIYVGNVDYGTTVLMLEDHFRCCGQITRLTIPTNKFTGTPKGFAYIQFGDQESMELALRMDDSVLRGRPIRVVRKRANQPGLSNSARPPYGRGFRGGPRGGFDTRPGRGGFSNGYSRPRMYSTPIYYNPFQ